MANSANPTRYLRQYEQRALKQKVLFTGDDVILFLRYENDEIIENAHCTFSIAYKTPILVRWWMWKFIVWQAYFNRLLDDHNMNILNGVAPFSSSPSHYGRFWQNLSKNSRDLLFDRIWLFLIPMALKGINKAIKIEKGQQIL